MSRPRILVLTPDDVLRDRDGLSVYTRQMLDAVSVHADVEVVCLKSSEELSAAGTPRSYRCRHLDCTTNQLIARLRSLVASRPSYTFEYRHGLIVSAVTALIHEFKPEIVVYNHRRAAWLIQHIKTGDGIHRIYVCHNAEARSLETFARLIGNPVTRRLARRDARKTGLLEDQIISETDSVVCISQEDACDLRLDERGVDHTVIPTWMPDRPLAAPAIEGPPVILMAGSLNWPPKLKNAVWFSNEIFSSIRSQHPESRLIVAGLEAERLREHLVTEDNIEIHESPESLDPFFARASMFVIPERQEGGLKIKSVDAASRGMPIVSTTAGVSGSHLIHEEDVLIADSTEEFASAVLRINENPDLARRLGSSARAVARQYFNKGVVENEWVRQILSGV